MHKWYLIIISLVFVLISGCVNRSSDEEIKKLSSWSELNVGQLNLRIEQALANKLQWPFSSFQIITNLFGDIEDASEVSIKKKSEPGEAPSTSSIVYIRDGLLDDSVRGDWYEIHFDRKSDGSWRIRSARVAYRCWRGSDTNGYQGRLCP